MDYATVKYAYSNTSERDIKFNNNGKMILFNFFQNCTNFSGKTLQYKNKTLCPLDTKLPHEH